MFCKACGTEIAEDAKFCPKCGTQLENADNMKGTVSPEPNLVNNQAVPTHIQPTFQSRPKKRSLPRREKLKIVGAFALALVAVFFVFLIWSFIP